MPNFPLSVTVPHTIPIDKQVDLAVKLVEEGVDIIQTEGGTSSTPYSPGIQGFFEKSVPTKKELTEFIEQLNTNQFKDVQNFFNTMPRLKHVVKVKNPKTKKESEITLTGLNDFFG